MVTGAKTRCYLVDEKEISYKRNCELQHPIRVFNLNALEIDADLFIKELAPTFSLLELDTYDVKRAQVEFLKNRSWHDRERLDEFLQRYYQNEASLDEVFDIISDLTPEQRYAFDRRGIGGRRKRSIASFELDTPGVWNCKRVPSDALTQKGGSDIKRPPARRFKEMAEVVTKNHQFQLLLQRIGNLVLEVRPSVSRLMIKVHQTCIYADVLSPGDNSPEGIHQDGADYIVSALVVERAGIVGGESIVYGPDKETEYLRWTLKAGEGLFQADEGSPLWHKVTLVREDPAVQPDYGHRSIFGFDIHILE